MAQRAAEAAQKRANDETERLLTQLILQVSRMMIDLLAREALVPLVLNEMMVVVLLMGIVMMMRMMMMMLQHTCCMLGMFPAIKRHGALKSRCYPVCLHRCSNLEDLSQNKLVHVPPSMHALHFHRLSPLCAHHLQRSSALAARVGEDGVLAFCRRPVVRGRPNERFLTSTLRGVFNTNRRVDEQLMWETRNMQREREEREQRRREGSTGSTSSVEDAQDVQLSEGQRGRQYKGEEGRGEGSQKRREEWEEGRRRGRADKGRGSAPECVAEGARAVQEGRGHKRRRPSHSPASRRSSPSASPSRHGGSGRSARLCPHSPAAERMKGRDGPLDVSAGDSGDDSSAGNVRSATEGVGSCGRSGAGQREPGVQRGEEAAGWAPMSDEDVQRMLSRYQVRGSGSVGSQVEQTGPYLPPEARAHSLEGVARGPAVPAGLRQQREKEEDADVAARALLARDPGLAKVVRKLAKQQAQLDALQQGDGVGDGRAKKRRRKEEKRQRRKEEKKTKKKNKKRKAERGKKEKRGKDGKERHAAKKKRRPSRSSDSDSGRDSSTSSGSGSAGRGSDSEESS